MISFAFRHDLLFGNTAELFPVSPLCVFFRFILPVFQYIAWLAVEYTTKHIQGLDPDGLRLSVLEKGKVGQGDPGAYTQLIQAHFAPGHHDV